MGPVGSALQLRMRLGGDEPRVIAQLHVLDEAPVGRDAAEAHAGRVEPIAIGVVDLEPVPVALVGDLAP